MKYRPFTRCQLPVLRVAGNDVLNLTEQSVVSYFFNLNLSGQKCGGAWRVVDFFTASG